MTHVSRSGCDRAAGEGSALDSSRYLMGFLGDCVREQNVVDPATRGVSRWEGLKTVANPALAIVVADQSEPTRATSSVGDCYPPGQPAEGP